MHLQNMLYTIKQNTKNVKIQTMMVASLVLFAPLFINKAMANVLLKIDLSVENQISIFATDNSALVSAVGTDFNGIYLDNLFGIDVIVDEVLIEGDLSTANEPSNNSPQLFTSSNVDPGLNIFDMTNETNLTTTLGQAAFTGSAIWTVNTEAYQAAVMSAISGNLFLNADSLDDLDNNDVTLIGSWEVVNSVTNVSAPSVIGFLYFIALILVIRRQNKDSYR
jgi:hypothetical protein